MMNINFMNYLRKSIVLLLFICVSSASISYSAESMLMTNTVSLLESIRQNYYAHERLKSLMNNNTASINKDVPSKMWLKKVKASEVNMVSNRFTGEQQDAVIINGKKYYANGKEYAFNLKENPSIRFSVDPLTNITIDKADAVTYSDASGRIVYFESDLSSERFLSLANSETLYGYSK